MNKHYLMSKMKSSGIAHLCWFFVGCHYAYLGRWGTQILFWITACGLGVWYFLDLFLIPGKVNRHNRRIADQIQDLELRAEQDKYNRMKTLQSSSY